MAKFSHWLMLAAIAVQALGVDRANAWGPPGRSYSSGSRSFSSGSRSSSSGSRSFSPSPSRSYSSGRPSAPAPRSSSPPASRPSTPAPRPSSPPPSRPSTPSYRSTTPTRPSTPSTPSSRPQTGFDSSAARKAREIESTKAFQQSQQNRTNPNTNRAPPPSTRPFEIPPISTQPSSRSGGRGTFSLPDFNSRTSPRPQAPAYDPRDRRIQDLQRQLDDERWRSRQSRSGSIFSPYGSRVAPTYNDPFSGLFWYWLLDQSADTRARWYYSHRDLADQRRYNELLEKDRELEKKLADLKAKQTPPDPNYTPPGVDPDLMYRDDFVSAARAQPPGTVPDSSPAATPATPSADSPVHHHSPPPVERSSSSWLSWMLTLGAIAFLIWIVFFKRWDF